MSVSSNNFDVFYYSNVCFGYDEFKKSKGQKLAPKVKNMIDELNLTSDMNILEIGCGRGDASIYIARKVNSVAGIDYSKEAIKIANNIKKLTNDKIKNKVSFYVMQANKLEFKDNLFDMVIVIDTLDHLNKKEVNQTFSHILRILKPNGSIFIKTCANKVLLDITYRYYILPINRILTMIDKKIKGISYESLPNSSRTIEAKKQHVNEADYFYLKSLFTKFKLSGKIWGETGFLTQDKGIRSKLYNFIVTLNPLSKYYPFNIFFAHSFFAKLHKNNPI